MNSSGVVFNIQRFSIHDGPGIRSTVFLKGCSMRCFWCHNPEGRHFQPELRYFPGRCIACGACVEACPNHAHELREGVHTFFREYCLVSGECVQTCYPGALELNGRQMSVDEVLEEVLRDRPFYESSHGGVTLSGGEPALAGVFAREILERCHAGGIHTAIETCGDSPWHSLEALLPWTDLVIMDIKLISPEKHLRATGRPNDRILANARNLAQTDKPLLFRTPIVPTVNDDPEEFIRIASFLKSLIDTRASGNNQESDAGGIAFELLPFHRLASDKYASLGMEYSAASLDPPTKSTMCALAEIATTLGVTTRIR